MLEMIERPKRHSSIRTGARPDGTAMLTSRTTEWAYTLAPLAALVWEFCDGTNDVDQIVEQVRAIPEVGATEDMKKDVMRLLDEFDDLGLLQSDEE